MPLFFCIINFQRPAQALLPLTLLEQQVIAAVALEHELAGTGLPNALFRTAMRMKLWHRGDSRGKTPERKEKAATFSPSQSP